MTTYDEYKRKHPIRLWLAELELAISEWWHGLWR